MAERPGRSLSVRCRSGQQPGRVAGRGAVDPAGSAPGRRRPADRRGRGGQPAGAAGHGRPPGGVRGGLCVCVLVLRAVPPDRVGGPRTPSPGTSGPRSGPGPAGPRWRRLAPPRAPGRGDGDPGAGQPGLQRVPRIGPRVGGSPRPGPGERFRRRPFPGSGCGALGGGWPGHAAGLRRLRRAHLALRVRGVPGRGRVWRRPGLAVDLAIHPRPPGAGRQDGDPAAGVLLLARRPRGLRQPGRRLPVPIPLSRLPAADPRPRRRDRRPVPPGARTRRGGVLAAADLPGPGHPRPRRRSGILDRPPDAVAGPGGALRPSDPHLAAGAAGPAAARHRRRRTDRGADPRPLAWGGSGGHQPADLRRGRRRRPGRAAAGGGRHPRPSRLRGACGP